MTLGEAVSLIKPLLSPGCSISAGHIDGSLERTVGVYPDKNAPKKRQIAIGGEECTLTRCTWLTLLIHFTKNPSAAEAEAYRLFNALCAAEFSGVSYLEASEPAFAGKDGRGIFEYVINFKIYECKEEI